jgi:carboxyl-terminal processing protease
MEKLDPFSAYMTSDEYDEMQLEFEGHFGGIGIVITIKDNKLTIISPIKGTPGDKVGLEAQDVITDIDDKPTRDMSQKKAVDLMRGEEGTEVKLTIDRKDEEEPLNFTIIRADIEIPYVESEMKTDKIGYIVISQFAKDVGKKVDKALENLKGQEDNIFLSFLLTKFLMRYF